jgi:hypothetical protein
VIHKLTLGIALALSAVSAYFSIAGMMAIFAASATSVAVMATALEFSKIIGASWLYRNWSQTSVAIKSYLSGAVIVLVLISSMGIFGYLSKAHIEQGVAISSTVGLETEIIQAKITEKQRALDTASKNIESYEQQTASVSAQTLDKNGTLKTKQLDSLRQLKEKSTAERDVIASELTVLLTQKARSGAQEAKMEAEVGPLKYIAVAVYGASDKDTIDRAVRWVILIIVTVFDPLAICLLIAANDGFIREKQSTNVRDDGIVEVSQSNIRQM